MGEVSGFDIVLKLLGGLGLFLFGMNRISGSLSEAAGDRVKQWLERGTSNASFAVLLGIGATAILDSSSVVIILVIALVNAGMLRFDQSLGVILGANIGTTISSQLFALDVDRFAPIALFSGLLLQLVREEGRAHQAGKVLLDFGLLFIGLGLMGDATEPLQNNEQFVAWLKGMENPLQGAASGALFTVAIQSSSATLGIAIKMAEHGILSLAAGVAIMMGAEVGTCADTLIASVGRSRAAQRAGIFHLVFNVMCVIVGLALFQPFLRLIQAIPGTESHQLANAHMAFNGIGVLLGAWFLKPAAWLLERVIPNAGGGREAAGGSPEFASELAGDA